MKVLEQQPEGEILGIGGPWMGQLSWQGRQLPGNYLLQDEMLDPSRHYVVVVETNQPAVKARNQVAFWLMAVDLADGRCYRSRASWPALYVEEVTDGQIGFYTSFHAGKPEQKQYYPFDLDTHFQPLS